MALKQGIVIVNEYTIKHGKKGSRGATPGSYVERYMGRKGATEGLTPVRLMDQDSYIVRYMARAEAVDEARHKDEIKPAMREAERYGGVAFGFGDVSLSDEKFRAASREIQRLFDAGKTVMKTVVSFDEDYLRENGIIDKDFTFEKRGDYRGNIDQMKLRMAIMNGMRRASRQYDDLQYVGVIQVDTAHVHAHLAMVDRGRGHIMPDGRQRGKVNEKFKRNLRRGIDSFLDQKQRVKMMASTVGYDKRNARCYIKRYAHETMAYHGPPQFLLACLPENKNHWRAATNRKDMRKANAIVREYVTQVLRQPKSGYRQALRSIDNYASTRRVRDRLSGKEYRKLIEDGKEALIQDCMNGVYSVLKNIPDRERKIWTPMISAMSMDYVDMSAIRDEDPMLEFGFKLRSYSSRLRHHRKERNKYRDLVKSYKATPEPSEDAKPLAAFLEWEEEYNAKLMCKYQHFLSFLPPGAEYEGDFNNLMDYKRALSRMKAMRADKDMKRMQAESAEDYGQKVYGLSGGRHVPSASSVLETRENAMQTRYETMEEEFRYKLSNYGLTLDEKGVSNKKPYEFDEVKALDIHHLGYDWAYDIDISQVNVKQFLDATDERVALLEGAVEYLEASDQSASIAGLPVKDIKLMQQVADQLRFKPQLEVRKAVAGGKSRSKTVPLDADYNRNMQLAIEAMVLDTQRSFGEQMD